MGSTSSTRTGKGVTLVGAAQPLFTVVRCDQHHNASHVLRGATKKGEHGSPLYRLTSRCLTSRLNEMPYLDKAFVDLCIHEDSLRTIYIVVPNLRRDGQWVWNRRKWTGIANTPEISFVPNHNQVTWLEDL